MKALETSVGLGAISTLVEDCREPRRAEGGKKTPSELSQNVGYGQISTGTVIRIHIPCYGDLPLRIISHVAGQSERRLAFDPKRPMVPNFKTRSECCERDSGKSLQRRMSGTERLRATTARA